MPLNIDWQQILLHWMNLAILIGGLYFLLYKPVKDFMEKREAHYRELDRQAAGKLEEAEQIKAACQAKLDGAEAEIHRARSKAQQAAQQAADAQLAQAQEQGASRSACAAGLRLPAYLSAAWSLHGHLHKHRTPGSRCRRKGIHPARFLYRHRMPS